MYTNCLKLTNVRKSKGQEDIFMLFYTHFGMRVVVALHANVSSNSHK